MVSCFRFYFIKQHINPLIKTVLCGLTQTVKERLNYLYLQQMAKYR